MNTTKNVFLFGCVLLACAGLTRCAEFDLAEAVKKGGTVEVPDGTHVLKAPLIIDKDVVLKSKGGPGKSILDAQGKFWPVHDLDRGELGTRQLGLGGLTPALSPPVVERRDRDILTLAEPGHREARLRVPGEAGSPLDELPLVCLPCHGMPP